MPNYNFLNLSPSEFEDLTKDLLQQHLKLSFESFTSGRDNGIDLRYSSTNKNVIIVQCKRYSGFDSLISNLKKEVYKVNSLKPNRYILTTSAGLTPNQKDKILALFSPFLQSVGDIFGRDDLNNLLGLFPDIEKQHFKLWLSSINVIEKILHSGICNQSSFEEEKIKDTIKIYVENDSYLHAIKILKEKNYVIISGIPGIGKTTLARILVYHFLANGFQEFVFLSDSVNEAFDSYKKGVKQVFLFDDFLGRNFLEKRLSNNEEQRIVKLIEKVNDSKDKILILTTREYILAQAKQRYDVFENPSLEFGKCIIDLSQYTKIVRAKILYNHLFFSEMTEKYLMNILEKEGYKLIIQHRNYNPRIIQTIVSRDVWNSIEPEKFTERIIEFLDYPESIWKHVYENQISKFSQCVLANLMSAGTPILLNDLRVLIQSFAKIYSLKYSISYNELDFNKSIKELENTFIITKKDHKNQIAVEYQNPSIQDFLVNYFNELPDFLSDIINSAIFFNQLFTVFTIDENKSFNRKFKSKTSKIVLKNDLKQIAINKLLRDYESINSSLLYSNRNMNVTQTFHWSRQNFSDYHKLNEIAREIELDQNPSIKDFISKKFGSIIIPSKLNGNDFNDYLNLLRIFKNEHSFAKLELIEKYFDCIYNFQQLEDFELFKEFFPYEFENFISTSNDFKDKFYELLEEEVHNCEEDYLEGLLEEVESAREKFEIDCYDLISEIEEKIINKKEIDEAKYGFDWHEDYEGFKIKEKIPDENTIIKNMFDSLGEK